MTVDPRAGKLCCSCNTVKPADAKPHCPHPDCTWWVCARCGARNDVMGRTAPAPTVAPGAFE